MVFMGSWVIANAKPKTLNPEPSGFMGSWVIAGFCCSASGGLLGASLGTYKWGYRVPLRVPLRVL